jgi:hypothetical protein
MTKRNRNTPKPTCTSVVEVAMSVADDFLTASMLIALTNLKRNQVTAALSTLKRRYFAVDCIASDGKLWWFLTPGTDTRSRKVEMRRPEDRPRNRRPRSESSKLSSRSHAGAIF